MKLFPTPSRGERGATMVEYSLLVAVISMMSFSAVTLVGDSTGEAFDEAAAGFEHESGEDNGSVESTSGDSGGDSGGAPATTTTTMAPAPTTTAPPATTTTTAPPSFDTESDLTAGEVTSELTSWTTTRRGGSGEWTATFNYENDWQSDQYLTLEVTTVDHRGRTVTTTIDNFLVPADGSSSFDFEANEIRDVNGNTRGIIEVKVQVTSIATQDGTGQEVTFDLDDGPLTIADAPETP